MTAVTTSSQVEEGDSMREEEKGRREKGWP
jgi:hypothetical protein